jgi:hypothetical protein
MIGFYFTVQKDLSSVVKLQLESFDSFTKIPTPMKNRLYLFDDPHASMESFNGYTFYIVGTLIYKKRWNRRALKLVADDLVNGLTVEDIALNSKGQFCLIIHSSENVFIITDKLGSFPIYKYEKNDSLRMSNMLPLLAKRNDVTLAFQELAEFISLPDPFNYITTFFKEVRHLRRATICQFPQKQTSRVSEKVYCDMFDNIEYNKYRNLNKVAEMAGETLMENLSFLGPQDKIFADLTGGFDSRVSATILNHSNVKFVAGIMGKYIPRAVYGQTINEAKIAQKAAKALNVKFCNDFCIQSYEQFNNLVHEHYNIFNGVPQLYYSSDLIGYYENIKSNYDIHLTGMLGTQVMCRKNSLEGMTTDNRINVDGFIRKSFEYKSVISDKYITESQYYDNLHEKVIETVGTSLCDDPFSLLMLLVFDTYGRFHHGSAMGTHNCILPPYSPYIDADLLKVMFEASSSLKYFHNIQKHILAKFNSPAASVMTTHGYKASVSSELFSKRFLRVKKVVKTIKNRSIEHLKCLLRTDREDSIPKFWLRAVNENYFDNMKIFDIVDKVKLENVLWNSNDTSKNRLKAKIIYLNKIIEEYQPGISA